MSIQLTISSKDSERFLSVANFISKYYYELAHGVILPLNDEAFKGFEKGEKDVILKFINSADTKKYSNSLILREINNKIFDYYSKNIELNTESSRNILNSWRNNTFQSYLDETEYLKDSINKKIETQIAFINIDNKSYQEKLKLLAEKVNPYSAFSEKEINLIDHNFFKKNSILNKINHGNDFFKKSKLKESLDCYDEAIKFLSAEKEIENLHLYFYSWVLHQLGNIYYVVGNFEKASSLYNNSFSIKIKIEELPKPLLFSTQLKIFGLLSYFPLENKNWNFNLANFIKKVKEYHQQNTTENELFVSNLIFDANYYLFNGYINLNDKDNSEKYFNIAIINAKANKDFAGTVKTYFSQCMFENSEKHLIDLKETINNASDIEKTDPYVTTIFKNSKLTTTKSNKNMLDKIKKVFADNEIKIIE